MHGRTRSLVALVLTVAGLVVVARAWPDGDGAEALESGPRAPTTAAGTPALPDLPGVPTGEPNGRGDLSGGAGEAVDLFRAGADAALAEVLAAAGGPQQLIDIGVYPTYLILAYVDPAQPEHIDRRVWRPDRIDGPDPNPIDDRVDDDTRPALFEPTAVDLSRLPAMTADAVGRYDRASEVTHVLIDRFLPFDERVLVRVYVRPSDGRSGGGYVTYTPDGTHVDTCC